MDVLAIGGDNAGLVHGGHLVVDQLSKLISMVMSG